MARMAPWTEQVLRLVGASEEPVSRALLVSEAGSMIPPAHAYRSAVNDINNSRRNSPPGNKGSDGRLKPFRIDLNDHERLVKHGRRVLVMENIQALVRRGRLVRTEHQGQPAYIVGPRPLDPDVR